MITIAHTLTAKKPLAEVYALFNDMATLTQCVPQCTGAKIIDADHFDVHLLLKLGIIPLENDLNMQITERQPPHRLVVTGVGRAGKGLAQAARLADSQGETRLRISFDLKARDAATTEVHCQIDAEAAGNLKRVYEGIIKGQRAKLEASFVQNVSKVLDCPVELMETHAEFAAEART